MCQKLWKFDDSRQSYCKNYLAYFFLAHPVYSYITWVSLHDLYIQHTSHRNLFLLIDLLGWLDPVQIILYTVIIFRSWTVTQESGLRRRTSNLSINQFICTEAAQDEYLLVTMLCLRIKRLKYNKGGVFFWDTVYIQMHELSGSWSPWFLLLIKSKIHASVYTDRPAWTGIYVHIRLCTADHCVYIAL